MTEKKIGYVIRKLALPLEFKLGNNSIASDGFFTLSHKDTSKIIIKSQDSDGYLVCELFEPEQIEATPVSSMKVEPTLIATKTGKHRGRGKEIGQYKYFEMSNGSFIAEILGKRKRRIHLGKMSDHSSPISKIACAIASHFQNEKEFDRKELIRFLEKKFTYGQVLKSVLDILTMKLYVEKRETQKLGRPYERYKATSKLYEYAIRPITSFGSEQAQNEKGWVAK